LGGTGSPSDNATFAPERPPLPHPEEVAVVARATNGMVSRHGAPVAEFKAGPQVNVTAGMDWQIDPSSPT